MALTFDFFLDHLQTQQLTVGGVFYPTTDGSAGQYLETDGAGNITFATSSAISGPGTSTDEAIPTFDGTTGKLIKNTAALLNTAGDITCTSITAAGLVYPTSDGTEGAFLKTDGLGNLTFTTGISDNSLCSDLSVTQTTNVVDGDHIKIDNVSLQKGSLMSLDTTTPYTTTAGAASIGRYTLAPNFTYQITYDISSVAFNKQTGVVKFQLWNATSDTAIGKLMSINGSGQILGDIHINHAYTKTIFSPTVSTLIEVRIVSPFEFVEIHDAYIDIKEV